MHLTICIAETEKMFIKYHIFLPCWKYDIVVIRKQLLLQ